MRVLNSFINLHQYVYIQAPKPYSVECVVRINTYFKCQKDSRPINIEFECFNSIILFFVRNMQRAFN